MEAVPEVVKEEVDLVGNRAARVVVGASVAKETSEVDSTAVGRWWWR